MRVILGLYLSRHKVLIERSTSLISTIAQVGVSVKLVALTLNRKGILVALLIGGNITGTIDYLSYLQNTDK